MTNRPTFKAMRDKALKRPGVKTAYDHAAPTFAVKRELIAMRTAAGKTQEQMAELLGTKKSSISRLESMNSDSSPTLSRIEEYASALGYRLKVEFELEATAAY